MACIGRVDQRKIKFYNYYRAWAFFACAFCIYGAMKMYNFKFTDKELLEYMVSLRRQFHKYPETGWNEYRTSAVIAEIMENLGYKIIYGCDFLDKESRMGIEKSGDYHLLLKGAEETGADEKYLKNIKENFTGICAVKKFSDSGKRLVLRADIDALPVEEAEKEGHFPFDKGFASCNKGISHACGHDGHMAAAIGCAKALEKIKDNIEGEIVFLFQPAEEGCRGGLAVANGSFINKADYFLSGHIGIGLKKTGIVSASSTGFLSTSKMDVYFKGKSAHAANAPQEGRNAVLSAAAFVLAANSIPRHSDGNSFINTGIIHGGAGRNIVADSSVVCLETRGQTAEINEYMKNAVIKAAEGCGAVYGTESKIVMQGSAMGCLCDKEMVETAFKAAEEGGFEAVKEAVFGASEDAVNIMGKIQKSGGKCTYMMFGSNLKAPHHSSEFDFDEKTIGIMAECYCRTIEKLMCKNKEEKA